MVDAETLLAVKDLLNRFGSDNLFTEEKFVTSSSGRWILFDGKLKHIIILYCVFSIDFRSNYLMNDKIAGVEEADFVLIIGTNPRYEAPILNARIRKRFQISYKNTDCLQKHNFLCSWMHYDLKIGLIGSSVDLTYDYEVYCRKSIFDVDKHMYNLWLYKHLGTNLKSLQDLASGKHKFCDQLSKFKRPMILVGSESLQRQDGEAIYAICRTLAKKLRTSNKQNKVLNVLHQVSVVNFSSLHGIFGLKEYLRKYVVYGSKPLYIHSVGFYTCFMEKLNKCY